MTACHRGVFGRSPTRFSEFKGITVKSTPLSLSRGKPFPPPMTPRSDVGLASGIRNRKAIGRNFIKLLTVTASHKFEKFVDVTPSTLIRPAPSSSAVFVPALESDIRKAKSVPSIPGGQRRAARTCEEQRKDPCA